ncbi:hypothetical protein SAMN05421686_102342 [Thalassolituus maritimus]|uniref:Uncharacterized protein n=1 Tax=Thalassolituus maritimus TaxID=484498 RepID=A0A1N7K674_9GAMM|nr:hypothetical protein [Thalassolituus maritimus]SIS57040.1 hypothetical protein SAMN05421686_102342 [Thalassolituus maritimus]
MLLLLTKILVTFLTVVMLAVVARRYGPAWAGILAGFPLGSAITLYFMGFELGSDFAAEGATHTLIGLTGSLALAISYLYASRRWYRPRHVLIPALLALSAFLATVAPLQYWNANWWQNALIILALIAAASRLLRSVPDAKVALNSDNLWQRPAPAILFRAVMATISVLGITALAHWLSPSEAGLLAAFPVSFFPTLIVLQLSYGAPVVAATVKQYPEGLVSMVIYVASVTQIYPLLGLQLGTAAALLIATLYLFGYALVKFRLNRSA